MRDEEFFHMNSPGTPVSKCWAEEPVADTKLSKSPENASYRSQPEVDDDDSYYPDPTFEDATTFGKSGMSALTKSNWVDDMWSSDEE